jgi:hypothetical protein
MTELTPHEARAALDAIDQGRRYLVEQIAVPAWYWGSVALGWIVLGVLADLAPPWVTAAATLAFGAVHSIVAPRVVDGRHGNDRVRVRTEVIGRRVAVWVLGGLVALVGVTVAAAFALDADGSRHPSTAASVLVGVIVVLGGPMLLAWIRRSAQAARSR